jgi:hypothetical protein
MGIATVWNVLKEAELLALDHALATRRPALRMNAASATSRRGGCRATFLRTSQGSLRDGAGALSVGETYELWSCCA